MKINKTWLAQVFEAVMDLGEEEVNQVPVFDDREDMDALIGECMKLAEQVNEDFVRANQNKPLSDEAQTEALEHAFVQIFKAGYTYALDTARLLDNQMVLSLDHDVAEQLAVVGLRAVLGLGLSEEGEGES